MPQRLRAWALRLLASLRGTGQEDDLSAELASHLQLHIDDNLRAGMSPDEARRQALLKLGGLVQTKEAQRDRLGLPWVDSLGRDVKYAIRFLRRSPGFTAVAILSLALGIGANTAIFSLVDALLLRSLPVKQPDRLVELLPGNGGMHSWSTALWEQIRARPDLFAGACAFSPDRFNLATAGETELANGLYVSGDFFQVLGVGSLLGRTTTADDDRPGGGRDGAVTVISYEFWQRHFGGSGSIIGEMLMLNGVPFTIAGVVPAGFYGPLVGRRFDVMVPIGTAPLVSKSIGVDSRSEFWLTILARLKGHQTIAAASTRLRAQQPAMRAATLPTRWWSNDLSTYLKEPFAVRAAPRGPDSALRVRYQAPLMVMMLVVGLVLLIACVNLANLLLARAEARRHELSIRRALGASRIQLLRQLLVESLSLSLVGAGFGLAFAMVASRVLLRQLANPLFGTFLDLSVDWRVLGFTAAVSVMAALLFGMAPGWRATAVCAHDALSDRSFGASGQARGSFSGMLIGAQVALCLVLVVAAGLFLRTFTSIAGRSLGFDAGSVLVVDLPSTTSGTGAAARNEISNRIREAVAVAPGVAAAALSSLVPLGSTQSSALLENPAGVSLSEDRRHVQVNFVSPDWFATMGTRLISGRDFTADDRAGSAPVVIVNRALADRYFSGRGIVGRTVREVASPGHPAPVMTIVGVAANAVYDSLRDTVRPAIYVPLTQGTGMPPFRRLVVRAANGSSTAIMRDVASAISSVDPHLSFAFRTMSDLVGESRASERILAILCGFFGSLALLLAAIGLYGVVSYGVNRRRTEIGIRMALGARPGGIVRMMVGQIGLTMAIGLGIGGALSIWLATFVKSLLYGLQPNDPTTLAGSIAVLGAAGLLAAWFPARRAARIDPMEALREQ